MIDNTLIENALALTGKTMEDMVELQEYYATGYDTQRVEYGFSIEKFCYYLLSEEFLKQHYIKIYPNETIYDYENFLYGYVEKFGIAIFQYQKGNKILLIELLSKIGN